MAFTSGARIGSYGVLSSLGADSWYATLRNEPRFQALVKRVTSASGRREGSGRITDLFAIAERAGNSTRPRRIVYIVV
jgi:hypothetical protein